MGEINVAEVEALCAALDSFGPEPLTLQQVHALLFIAAHPGSTLQELAEHLGVTASAASRMALVLGSEGRGKRKGLGWTFVKGDVHDLRKRCIHPSAAGRRVVSKALAAVGRN